MEVYISFSREEVLEQIPFPLICETMCSSIWSSGKVKRRFVATFSEADRKAISRLKQQAYTWHLRTGVPENVLMSHHTYELWQGLAEFCASI